MALKTSKGRVIFPFKLYDGDDNEIKVKISKISRMKELRDSLIDSSIEPIRIPYWRFLVQYARLHKVETEEMLTSVFKETGLNTERRLFWTATHIGFCESSYMVEKIIMESIIEHMKKEQYELLIKEINRMILKLRPENVYIRM